jgi:hypothetical protein
LSLPLPFIYNESIRREGKVMKKQRYYFTEAECRILIRALTALRNKRIAEGKTIFTINDTILAVMNAKTKRIRVAG